MTDKPSAAAVRAAQSKAIKPQGPPPDQLAAMQAMVKEARYVEQDITDLEERLKEKKALLNEIILNKLPAMMEEAGVNVVGIPAVGNMPAMEARIRPFYSANIAAGWDVERRDKAFRWLEDHGHGDLIKTKVEVSFPRGNLKTAKALAEQASKKKGAAVNLTETIPSQTLTAWLREEVERRKTVPGKEVLEMLGATIGKKVDLKDVKQ